MSRSRSTAQRWTLLASTSRSCTHRGTPPTRCRSPSGPEYETVVLTGDTILGRGTTVVAHPDGRLGPYLKSLTRLAELRGAMLLPGHGPVRPDVAAVAAEYLAHRQERLDQVRAALAAGARTPHEVVEVVYADVDRTLWPAAEQSVRAQLDYLTSESSS